MDEILTQRWDLGLGNPNKAGAVLACALVLIWLGAVKWRNAMTVAGFALAGLLALTGSRGGLVASLAGLAVVASVAWWKADLSLSLRVAGVMGISVVLFLFMPQTDRPKPFGGREDTNAEDYSLTNRWSIYRKVPAMIAAAPQGWGWGRSGDAYMQWFQELGRLENYRSLVSTHATVLVEGGWMTRATYTALWACALTLAATGISGETRTALTAAARLGCLVAFGVACTFSTVGEAIWCWGLPIIALASAIYIALRRINLAVIWRRMAVSSTGACLLLLALALVGMIAHAEVSCPSPGLVVIGSGAPKLALIQPDRIVLGDHYGQVLRAWCARTGHAALVVNDITMSSWNCPLSVVSGALPKDSSSTGRRLLLNPPLPNARTAEILRAFPDWKAVIGEHEEWRANQAWQALATHPDQLHEAPGCAHYLRDWTPFLDLWK